VGRKSRAQPGSAVTALAAAGAAADKPSEMSKLRSDRQSQAKADARPLIHLSGSVGSLRRRRRRRRRRNARVAPTRATKQSRSELTHSTDRGMASRQQACLADAEFFMRRINQLKFLLKQTFTGNTREESGAASRRLTPNSDSRTHAHPE